LPILVLVLQRISIASAQCDAGRYQDGAKCTICPDSTTSPIGTSSISGCVCVANFYGDYTNCQACPSDATSMVGSTSIQDCACTPNLYRVNNICVNCPSQSISPSGSLTILQCQCAQNYWLDVFSSQCTYCGLNEVSPFGSTSMSACGCDSTSYDTGASCVSCPSNAQLANNGATDISACACNSNFWLDSKTGICQVCAATSLAAAASTSQTQCKCPVQRYMDGAFTQCLSCPGNSIRSSSGATSIAQCLCNPNYYLSGGLCLGCPANSARSTIGGSRIEDCLCDQDHYLDYGTGLCSACGAGFVAAVGSIGVGSCGCAVNTFLNTSNPITPQCSTCPTGASTDVGNTAGYESCSCLSNQYLTPTACTICSPGMTSPTNSLSEQQSCTCAPGDYKKDNVVGCVQCPMYSFTEQQVGGARAVQDCICPSPHMLLNNTTEQCELKCPVNMLPETLGTSCIPCAENFYLYHDQLLQQLECRACPAKSRSSNGSVAIESCQCEPGTYWVPETSVCKACGSSHFCVGDGLRRSCDVEAAAARAVCHTNLSTATVFASTLQECSCLSSGELLKSSSLKLYVIYYVFYVCHMLYITCFMWDLPLYYVFYGLSRVIFVTFLRCYKSQHSS